MFIDTHCHLSSDDYSDIDLIINENRNNFVKSIIVSACTKNSIIESINLAKNYQDVYLTLGYHPSEARNITKDDLIFLEKKIIDNKKIVGIGEIGLDYHYGKDDKSEQQFLFREQLKLADKLKLPVVIHTRDATDDTISILDEFPNVVGVIHCFSGSIETANRYISMGYKIGIGGVITFKNSKLYQVVKSIGIDNILLETDSPYLTPEPFRGKKNSSKYLKYIAERVAEVLNLSIEDVSSKTIYNTLALFDLN